MHGHAHVLKRSLNARRRQSWYNSYIDEARRVRRKFEKKWRKTGLEVYHQLYINENKTLIGLIENANKCHILEELQSSKDSKTMFRVVNGLLNNSNKVMPAHESAEVMSNNFAEYFQERVCKVYYGLKKYIWYCYE